MFLKLTDGEGPVLFNTDTIIHIYKGPNGTTITYYRGEATQEYIVEESLEQIEFLLRISGNPSTKEA